MSDINAFAGSEADFIGDYKFAKGRMSSLQSILDDKEISASEKAYRLQVTLDGQPLEGYSSVDTYMSKLEDLFKTIQDNFSSYVNDKQADSLVNMQQYTQDLRNSFDKIEETKKNLEESLEKNVRIDLANRIDKYRQNLTENLRTKIKKTYSAALEKLKVPIRHDITKEDRAMLKDLQESIQKYKRSFSYILHNFIAKFSKEQKSGDDRVSEMQSSLDSKIELKIQQIQPAAAAREKAESANKGAKKDLQKSLLTKSSEVDKMDFEELKGTVIDMGKGRSLDSEAGRLLVRIGRETAKNIQEASKETSKEIDTVEEESVTRPRM